MATPKSMILGDRSAVLERHQDIRRLDVAVDDPLLVGVLDAAAHLDEQPQSVPGGQLPRIRVLGQRDALDVLHGEKRPPLVGRAGLERAGDVGVVHQGQGLALALESRQHLPGVHPPPDELERHPPPDRPLLFGLPHLAHSALADLLQQPEVADPLRPDVVPPPRRLRAVDFEQAFDLATEIVVVLTGLFEVRLLLIAWQLADRQKDLLGPAVAVDRHDDPFSESLRRNHAWA